MKFEGANLLAGTGSVVETQSNNDAVTELLKRGKSVNNDTDLSSAFNRKNKVTNTLSKTWG